VNDYFSNGYAILTDVFNDKDIAKARSVVDEVVANAVDLGSVAELEPSNPSIPRRIWAPSARYPEFASMARNARLLDRLEPLLGPNIELQYTKLNMKGPKVDSVVEWHQDFSYYPHTNTDLLSVLIYLDDATDENACLQVVPQSHKRGLLDHSIDGWFRGKVTDPAAVKGAVSVPGKAGTCVVLHCLTLHASPKNFSDRYRRVYIPAYRAADARPIYFGPHAAHNEPGEVVRGQRVGHARVQAQQVRLPIAEQQFGSLFELQEGVHVKERSVARRTGYESTIDG
jgi:hypothetical protein